MLHDLRSSVRGLLKQPAFSLITVLTLALGIGATAAIFSLVQATLLTPPPYRDPSRLVLITPSRADAKPIGDGRGWPAQQWMDWQQHTKSFEGLAAYGWSFNFLVLKDGSQSLEGMGVTGNYFSLMGLKPLKGRTFSTSEAAFPTKPVIILGYNVWQEKFGGDPAIIGKKIRISRRDTPPEVIGVMPPGIRFLPSPTTAQEPNYNPNAPVDFWSPAAPDPKNMKDPGWNVVARLRPGTTLQQAQAELTVATKQESRDERDFADITPAVRSLGGELNQDGGRVLWPLFGAAILVLLIACGNAASLMLVRGLQRQQEYSLRSALGVGRAQLLWQASAENVVVALVGGVLGMVLAAAIVGLFKAMGGRAIPRLDAVAIGWPLLLGGCLAAMFSAVLAGLIPALRASRVDPAVILKSAGPRTSVGRTERRFLHSVAILQAALTLSLLVGAGLLVRTMKNLADVRAGFDMSHVLTMSVTAVQGNWGDFHRRALERVSALPKVQYAAFAWGVPLTGNSWPANVEVEGQPLVHKESDRLSFPLRSVTPDYFKLMGMGLLDGRPFRNTDAGEKSLVAVVNQVFADRYFPHQNPIGKSLWFSGRDHSANKIIGVVENSRTADLTAQPSPEIYLSFWQASPFSKHLVVRATADPRQIAAAVQHELRSIDPTVAVENVKPMQDIRGESLAPRTFATRLLTGFSIMGTLLTLIGIYGVLSLSVASRRREIAIRSAVGAERRDIRKMILGEGLRLILGGIVFGIFVAFAATRLLKSFLFEVSQNDPFTLIAVSVLFAFVALLACWMPSRRAMSVEPAEALRYE
jgi:putative ABC transport system permease protein